MRGFVRALTKQAPGFPTGIDPTRGWTSTAGGGFNSAARVRNLMRTYAGRENGVVWVFACVSLIASTGASYPYHFEDAEENEVDRPPDEVLRLVRYPNEDVTYFDFVEAVLTDLELVGNSLWVQARTNAAGQPFEMRRLPPDKVRIALDRQGMIMGYVYDTVAGPVPYRAEEVAHFKYPCPWDEHWGMGTVEGILRSLDAEIARAEHVTRFFQEGARLSGVLTVPETMTDDEFERFEQQFTAQLGGGAYGASARYGILVAEGATGFHPVTAAPRDAGIVDLTKISKDEILSGFGIPGFLLGGVQDAGIYKMEEAQHIFLRAMLPRSRRFEERMTLDVVRRVQEGLHFKLEPEASEPPSVKIAYAKDMLHAGASLDEARRVIGLEEFGDEMSTSPMIPTNAIPLRLVEELGFVPRSLGTAVQAPPQLPAPETPAAPPPGPEPVEGTAVEEPPAKRAKALAEPPEGFERRGTVKARALGDDQLQAFVEAHARVLAEAVPKFREEFARFARGQRDRVLRALAGFAPEKGLARTQGKPHYKEMTPGDLFDKAREDPLLLEVYLPVVDQVGERSLRALDGALGISLDWRLTHPHIAAGRKRLAEKITRVNQTTKDAVAGQVDEGLRRGYSLLQIANGYPDEEYKGIVGVFDDAAGYRAEMIARSESAMIYNAASTAAYRDAGFGRVEILDGLGDAPCAEANGSVWTIDEFEADPIAHPNCIRTGVPTREEPS